MSRRNLVCFLGAVCCVASLVEPLGSASGRCLSQEETAAFSEAEAAREHGFKASSLAPGRLASRVAAASAVVSWFSSLLPR